MKTAARMHNGNPVAAALAKLPDAKQNASGWSARCPAHEDRNASLSIGTGDDGRCLLHCHAGCTPEAVAAAIGLTLADLMPPRDAVPRHANGRSKTPATIFRTAAEAVATLERQHGPRAATWTYHNASGEPVGVVVRWDKPEGKDFRPVSLCGTGWTVEAMPTPRPLYRLPDLLADPGQRVFVTEGEKATDAAASIGLLATTSAGGAKAPGKADWSALAGRDVVLLPDNDKPGQAYAREVAATLSALSPPAHVRIVDLAGLPGGGDVFDWIEQRDAHESEELAATINALADAAPEYQPPKPEGADVVEAWRPFPVAMLPEPLRGFVTAAAKAIDCDASYVAVPLLVVLAAAIGNTRRLQLKRGWYVPAILWAAIVGESGTAKTPAFRLAMKPIRDRQRKALARQADAMRNYERDLQLYEADRKAWQTKGRNANEPPPEKPPEPQAERCVVSDTTVEGLAPILLGNPRGLLLSRDELNGWIGSFDRYASGGKGADAAHWLSMFNGESIIIDRKTGVPRTIFVPHASVSICGGVQPGILHRALGIEHRESGLAARLLLTCPPRKAKRWTEADIDPAAETQIAELLERLYELQPTATDDGELLPVVVRLSPEAKAAWKAYFTTHNAEQVDLAGELSAAWSKLEEYAPRLALVVHFARWAARDVTLQSPDVLDVVSMAAGVALAEWFKGEARRAYSLFAEDDEQRELRELVEWIAARGGRCTVRDVTHSPRQYRGDTEGAEAKLRELVKRGKGRWEPVPPGPKGGKPSRVFVLKVADAGPITTTKPDENEVMVPGPVVPHQNNGHTTPESINELLQLAEAEAAEDW